MLVLEKYNDLNLSDPKKFNELSVDVKNYLYGRLDKGLVLFIVPDEFNDKDKAFYKAYKAGFLSELLVEVYGGNLTKNKIHSIISDKYFMFNTRRNFDDLLKHYNSYVVPYIR